MRHDELLKSIKATIDQLANDASVPQRQIIRELREMHHYIGSIIPIVEIETAERNE
jgi:hypothetical protein